MKLPWRKRARIQPGAAKRPIRPAAGEGATGIAYRAAGIIAGAIAQLPLREEAGGIELSYPSAVVRKPDPTISRAEWLEQVVLELLFTGNVLVRRYPDALVVDPTLRLTVVNGAVVITDATGQPVDAVHSAIHRRAGQLYGRGPIAVARETQELVGAANDRARRVWTGDHTGTLTTDQAITQAEAKRYRQQWNNLDSNGEPLEQEPNPTGIRVLGKGLTYAANTISVKEAMWLEAQAFAAADIARIFGVAPSLLLADGASQTYTNVSQEWLGMVRFTLIPLGRRIEDLFMAAYGKEVRLDFDVLLRADPTTRYALYESGMRAGWLDRDDIRPLEGLA